MALILHPRFTEIVKFQETGMASAILEAADYLREKYGDGPYPEVLVMEDPDDITIRVLDGESE